MLDREKIAELIYNYLDYMYCDNCRYNSEKDKNEFGYRPCDDCHRKNNGWAVSMATANEIANRIVNGQQAN